MKPLMNLLGEKSECESVGGGSSPAGCQLHKEPHCFSRLLARQHSPSGSGTGRSPSPSQSSSWRETGGSGCENNKIKIRSYKNHSRPRFQDSASPNPSLKWAGSLGPERGPTPAGKPRLFTYRRIVSTAHFFLAAFRRPRVPRHQAWIVTAARRNREKSQGLSLEPSCTCFRFLSPSVSKQPPMAQRWGELTRPSPAAPSKAKLGMTHSCTASHNLFEGPPSYLNASSEGISFADRSLAKPLGFLWLKWEGGGKMGVKPGK